MNPFAPEGNGGAANSEVEEARAVKGAKRVEVAGLCAESRARKSGMVAVERVGRGAVADGDVAREFDRRELDDATACWAVLAGARVGIDVKAEG